MLVVKVGGRGWPGVFGWVARIAGDWDTALPHYDVGVISMRVSREINGEVVARAGCGLPWEVTLAGLDRTAFPLLGALDPYGDAVFNHRQVPALLAELDVLPESSGGPWVGEVRALCELVLRRTHHDILFIGD
jgi:hypothetical protein